MSSSGGIQAPASSATATETSVAQANLDTAILALNTGRKDASVFNDSTANLYLSYTAAASATVFHVKLAAGQYWSMMPGTLFTGAIRGFWDAAGAGAARVTELT